jgi:hypothetical protein
VDRRKGRRYEHIYSRDAAGVLPVLGSVSVRVRAEGGFLPAGHFCSGCAPSTDLNAYLG